MLDLPSLGTILVELGEDHVLTVTLNRPEKLNAFNQSMLDDFSKVWAFAKATDDVHVIVLRAAGDRAFCSGVDVVEGYERHPNPFSEADPGQLLSPKLNHCWKPMIAAVHGMVAGGAFYWINESDIVIASEDATFFDPHVTYGLTSALEPIGLTRRIPLGEVLRWALMGNDERMSVERAHQIGLVSEIVQRPALWDRAHEVASLIAAKPPVAVQGTVRAIWDSLDTGRTHALATGLSYPQRGNPLSEPEVDRVSRTGRSYEVR